MTAVTYIVENRIATITINRPEKLNALNPDVAEGLELAFRQYEEGDALCAILTGAGDRAFSVGADLNNNPLDLWRGVPGLGVKLTKPVIAAVHGHVIGGAFVIAMHCDLMIAADNVRFLYPEVAVGFTGGVIAGLVGRIPEKIAKEFMLIGDPMDAQRAYEAGMINKVVPADELMDAAMAWATKLAKGAPLVTSALKQFADATTPASPSQNAADARRILLPVHTGQDRFEGEAAFREKREPVYVGR